MKIANKPIASWILIHLLTIFFFLPFAGPALAAESAAAGKTLIVGSEPNFPPFAIGYSEETADGFSVELWKAVAAESHLNYTLRVRPFHQLIEELKSGRIDVLVNVGQSEERRRYAGFSVPTVVDKGAIFVRTGQAGIESEADLAGKSIIVQKGVLIHQYALSKGWKKQLVEVNNIEEGMKLLAAGKHDALLTVKLPGLQTIKKLKLTNVRALDIALGNTLKLSFAVQKGNVDLLAEINEGLAITKANGIYDKLFEKWLGVYQERELSNQTLLRYAGIIGLILVIIFAYVLSKWRTEREFTQQQILDYRERTQLALEGGDLGLWDWSVPSGNVFFNERWCAMLGYPPDEIAPHVNSWKALVHPDDWSVINPVLNDHLAGKSERYESEHRMLHKNGHWIWVLDRGKVMERGIKGEPLRVVGTHLDITERKNNQDYLETLLAEQNAMLDNELIGIARVRNSRFIWVNPTFEKMLGYEKAELIGAPTSKLFISEEAYQIFSDVCHPKINSHAPYRSVIKQVCKDGRQLWVDLSCTIIDGNNDELMGVMIDVTEQKQAEDERLEVLNRINKIARLVPGFVYQYCLRPDGSACFPYASEGIRDIYRVSPEQVREDAAQVFDILHPDDYQGIFDSILTSAKNLSPWQYEYRVKFDDGSVRWLFGNALPNKQPDGSTLWHGFITDITERRKIEALLHDSETRNALILNCAELGTWDWEIKTGRVVFNEHWAEMRGYRLDEIKQHVSEWEKRIHPDDLPKIQAKVTEHFNTRSGFFHAEYRVLTKAGDWIWILDRGAVIEFDADGNPARMAGTEMDITLRKQADKELLESRERLYFALQGANDGMWDWNLVTGEVYYSPRWKSMLGYADDELMNTIETWENLVDPADRDPVYQQAQEYAKGQIQKFEVEFRMRHKDGRWVNILSRAKLAVDAPGRLLTPLRLIGTHVDISDRKIQERKRIEQEKAHRINLVREVNHRIKNNLQGITGILRQYTVKHPETLDPINQAISQMQSIAVIYGLQGQDSLSRVSLIELLGAISKGVESLWKVPFKLDRPPDWPEYIITENEAVPLALVLNELSLNAVKYGKNSGYVKISLRANVSDGSVQIAIRNHGNLPAGFNFENKLNLNTGLNLVASLLPPKGAKLSFEQQGSLVVALLELHPPILIKES